MGKAFYRYSFDYGTGKSKLKRIQYMSSLPGENFLILLCLCTLGLPFLVFFGAIFLLSFLIHLLKTFLGKWILWGIRYPFDKVKVKSEILEYKIDKKKWADSHKVKEEEKLDQLQKEWKELTEKSEDI